MPVPPLLSCEQGQTLSLMGATSLKAGSWLQAPPQGWASG